MRPSQTKAVNLSSYNYTDNSDFISLNESSVYTCELSTHNYTPSTVFSLNQSRESKSEFHAYTCDRHRHSTEFIDNSDADYVNIPTVVNVFYPKEKRVIPNLTETNTTNTQVTSEMGNSSNKIRPVVERTESSNNTSSNSGRSNGKSKIRRDVSLLAYNITPVCLGISESNYSFVTQWRHQPC